MELGHAGASANDTGEEALRHSAASRTVPVSRRVDSAGPYDQRTIAPRSIYHGHELQWNHNNAPHLKLTEDVLRCIFTWCTVKPMSLPFLDSIPFAITLTHVCAFWRCVALDTPVLRNKFALDYEEIDIPHVQEWLSRAKRFRISVYLGSMDDLILDGCFLVPQHVHQTTYTVRHLSTAIPFLVPKKEMRHLKHFR
ncbi:hypothetical protein AMATHDRAFT_7530 [Amanita thiersii Skay4041]|uniref:F-box domain-containing protein n=1 Tax=Amanita thiersii Skay4041 TaxID=703135 RepID=A0A2A9N7W2_9AGAR|nr:hypothetical protein AMATHDRAFT_7530 [Amanita thiersii Skay4041]